MELPHNLLTRDIWEKPVTRLQRPALGAILPGAPVTPNLPLRSPLLTALVLGIAAADASAYTVVTKAGRRLEATAEPKYNQGKALVLLPGGMRIIIDEADVDKKATEKANQGDEVGPATFRNEHLAAAKGLSASGGSVRAEGKDAPMPGAPASDPRPDMDRPLDDDHSVLEFESGERLESIRSVPVEFPRDAWERGEGGTVKLRATVAVSGAVVDIVVVQSATPALDRAAVAALGKTLFEPPELDGVLRPVQFTASYGFEPRPEPEPPPAPPTPSGLPEIIPPYVDW